MTSTVSILIPTRGRKQHLRRACESLVDNAGGAIEILVRVDDDDEEVGPEILWIGGARCPGAIIGGPRLGYAGLHRCYNELAKHATGEWLWMLNDDVEVLTERWVQATGSDDAKPAALRNILDEHGRETPIFPMVRRAGFAALGRWSANAYCDLWVGQLYAKAGAVLPPANIRVKHLRDQMNDEAVRDQERCGGTEQRRFFEEQQEDLERDAAKLRELNGRQA